MSVLVTGGAGFIGSHFVLDWFKQSNELIINLDKLTCAGNLQNLASLQGDTRQRFMQRDIGARALIDSLLAEHQPRAVVHFAAESHVDRSIHGPANSCAPTSTAPSPCSRLPALTGTRLMATRRSARFHHVSIDEVGGALSNE